MMRFIPMGRWVTLGIPPVRSPPVPPPTVSSPPVPTPHSPSSHSPTRRIRDNSLPTPRFLPSPVNVTFTKGEEAILQCSIENLGARVVVWRKASEPNPLTIGLVPYIENPRLSVTHDKSRSHWKLHIKNVKPRHAGVYECQISSKSNLIKLIMLRVNDSPSQIKPSIQISGTEVVDVGQPIKLQCNVTGGSKSLQALDWFKDGDKMTPNFANKISISKFEVTGTNTFTSYLEIEHSKIEDSGTYLCRNTDVEVARMYVSVLNTQSINKKRGGSAKENTNSKSNRAPARLDFSTNIRFLLTALLIALSRVVWGS
ncbi:MAM domain-containing glycosylphosphatidylinositol anchor protein 1-like [Liolophura sinensis]|uniref:MAM domain-containing glycosylphosphatidylinositol anchor protein 1-like n=1 Tax=Liolophura sinensis TaxID=3198878 RepID=UPI0031590B27